MEKRGGVTFFSAEDVPEVLKMLLRPQSTRDTVPSQETDREIDDDPSIIEAEYTVIEDSPLNAKPDNPTAQIPENLTPEVTNG